MFCYTWKPTWFLRSTTTHHTVCSCVRESGSGPPTHVRANSEPSPRRVPPKALANPPDSVQSGSWRPIHGRVGSLEPEPSRTREPDPYMYGSLYRTRQIKSLLHDIANEPYPESDESSPDLLILFLKFILILFCNNDNTVFIFLYFLYLLKILYHCGLCCTLDV